MNATERCCEEKPACDPAQKGLGDVRGFPRVSWCERTMEKEAEGKKDGERRAWSKKRQPVLSGAGRGKGRRVVWPGQASLVGEYTQAVPLLQATDQPEEKSWYTRYSFTCHALSGHVFWSPPAPETEAPCHFQGKSCPERPIFSPVGARSASFCFGPRGW